MKTSWLKKNYIGLLMVISIVLLLSVIFLVFGTSSTRVSVFNTKDGKETSVSTGYSYNWGLLGKLITLTIIWCPMSIYIGATSLKANSLGSFAQMSLFIPTFAGLAIVAFLDINAFCLSSLFYFIFAFVISVLLFFPLLIEVKKSRPTLFKVIIVVVIGLVCFAFVVLYVARPLVLLAYLLFALIVGLPLLALVKAPFRRVMLIPYLFFLFAVIAVRSISWTSRHHFLRNLGRIRAGRYLDREEPGMIIIARRYGQGMTFADVEEIMQGYPLLANGKFYRPLKKLYEPEKPFEADYVSDPNARKEVSIIDGKASYRHSGVGHFNADFGWVEFKKGKVVRTRFLPD